MTIPHPSPLFSGARDRARQARVLLLLGLICVAGIAIKVASLPGYYQTMAVSDPGRLYLVGMGDPFDPSGFGAFITSSPDAVHWAKPVVRPLSIDSTVRSAAALDNWLYLLLSLDRDKSSQLNAYGPGTWEGLEDWKVIDLPPAWKALGIGELHGRLWAFGVAAPVPPDASSKPAAAPDPEKKPVTLHSAFLQDGKWTDGPSLDISEGRPFDIRLVSNSSATFLYWRAAFPVKYFLFFEDAVLGSKLYRAKLEDKSFGPVESFDLGPDVEPRLVAEADRTLMLTQPVRPWWSPSRPISFFVIKDDPFSCAPASPVEIDSLRKSGLVEDDFAAARFGNTTFLILDARYFDLFLSGIYAFHLQDSRALEPALVLPASPIQVSVMVFWCFGLLLALSILASALSGYLRENLPPDPAFETLSLPPATLVERAIASALDLAFVSVVPLVMTQLFQRPPAEVGIAFVLTWLAYSAILETVAGRTLGKRVVGIQVLDAAGQVPALQASIVRNLLKPIEFVTIGPALILGSRRFQRLGDFLARTVVVSNPIVVPPRPASRDDEEGF